MDNFFIKKYPALKNADFTRLLTSQLLSQTGGFIQNVALSMRITQITDSRWWLGVFLFCCYLPVMVLAIPFSRLTTVRTKTVLIVSELLLFSLSLVVCIYPKAPFPLLLVYGALLGTLRAVQSPVIAAVPSLVCDKAHLHSAISLTTLALALSRALGPVIAGLLPLRAAFIINAISFVPSVFLISRSKLKDRKIKPQKPILPKYILLAVFVFSVLGIAYNVIFSGVIKNAGLDRRYLAVFMACVGVGAVIGTVIMRKKRVIPISCLGIPVCQMLIASSRSGVIISVLCVLYGLCDYLFFTSAISLIQSKNTKRSVTSAMGVYTALNTGASPLGFLAFGAADEFFGIVPALYASAALLTAFYLCYFGKIR